MAIPKSKVRFCIIISRSHSARRLWRCSHQPPSFCHSSAKHLLNGNTINGTRGVPGSNAHDAASRGHSGKAMRHQ
jgi:hypothetical protein